MAESLKRIAKSLVYNLVIGDLGIKLRNPGDSIDLLKVRSFQEVMASKSLDDALTHGWIELYDEDGTLLTGTTATNATNFSTLNDSGPASSVAVAESETDNGTKSTSFTIDFSASRFHKLIINGLGVGITLTPPDNASTLVLKVIQNAAGTGTLLWDAGILWPGGTSPTLTNTNAAVDIFTFYYDGTNFYGNITYNFS